MGAGAAAAVVGARGRSGSSSWRCGCNVGGAPDATTDGGIAGGAEAGVGRRRRGVSFFELLDAGLQLLDLLGQQLDYFVI